MKLRAEQGLTLIELLIALAVAAIVLLVVQGVFLNAGALRERSRHEAKIFHRSRVLFDRLERELGSTLYRSGHPYAHFILGNSPEQLLEFSTFASSPGVAGQSQGAVTVRYRWEEKQDAEGVELIRYERPIQDDSSQGFEQRLLDEVENASLRCYDGERWQESWDTSATSRLPRLLEISFEIKGVERSTPFRTVLEIGGGSGS